MSSSGVYDWNAHGVLRGPTKLSVPSRWRTWRRRRQEEDQLTWRDYVVASNEYKPTWCDGFWWFILMSIVMVEIAIWTVLLAAT